jgi:hypothetical protein
VSEFAASLPERSKRLAAKPTKMYGSGGIVKKKGLHHWIWKFVLLMGMRLRFERF